jgi:hypothetical protein
MPQGQPRRGRHDAEVGTIVQPNASGRGRLSRRRAARRQAHGLQSGLHDGVVERAHAQTTPWCGPATAAIWPGRFPARGSSSSTAWATICPSRCGAPSSRRSPKTSPWPASAGARGPAAGRGWSVTTYAPPDARGALPLGRGVQRGGCLHLGSMLLLYLRRRRGACVRAGGEPQCATAEDPRG